MSGEELDADMAASGVDRAVVVQAVSAYSDDNRYAADVVAGDTRRFAGVCCVDPTAPDDAGRSPGDSLAYWVGERGMAGLRLFAVGDDSWLDDIPGDDLWGRAGELGVPVVVTVLGNSIPRLATMLQRFPDTPVALDHCGFPDLAGGPPWSAAEPLFELARYPNLSLKVSTIVLDLAAPAAAPGEFVAALADRFGVERLMWGSDYPQTHDRSYRDLVALAREVAGVLGSGADLFLGGTALELWPRLA